MNRGGLETWLMDSLRKIDRSKIQFDFLVQRDCEGIFDNEIHSLGGKVIRCIGAPNPFAFSWNYKKALLGHGPYDIVHSHVHHFSGIVNFLSKLYGVPVTISHCHNEIYKDRASLSPSKYAYIKLTEYLIRRFSDYGLGCSMPAASDLFGSDWEQLDNVKVLHCGIDIDSYRKEVDKSSVCRSLNLEDNKLLIGHVGSFEYQKNHEYLIDTLEELKKRGLDFNAILIGNGDLVPLIKDKVRGLGLEANVTFLGDRDDVPRLLKAMDIFIFPSHFEGLGLALIEAQAAGTSCVISDSIPEEATVIAPLVTRLSLDSGVTVWCDKIYDIVNKRNVDRHKCYEGVKESTFNIDNSVQSLSTLYRSLLKRQEL